MELQQVGHARVPASSSVGAICLLTKRPHRGGIDCRGRSNAFARTFGATEGDPMPTPRVVLNSLEICCQGITPPHYSAHTKPEKDQCWCGIYCVCLFCTLILFLSDLTPIINELCNWPRLNIKPTFFHWFSQAVKDQTHSRVSLTYKFILTTAINRKSGNVLDAIPSIHSFIFKTRFFLNSWLWVSAGALVIGRRATEQPFALTYTI